MAAKKDPKKGKTKQPDPPAAPARTTKPSLSRASSDGPDPSLKAAKASEGKKKGPKKGVLDVQPGEKVVRVVDQSEEQAVGLGVDEAAVEGQGRGKSRKAKVAAGGTGVVDGLVETAGTRGNQRDDLLNELDADDQPVKSALKAPTTKSNKPGKKQEKAESSVSAKGKGKSPLVAAPARSSKSAAKTGKADVEATKGDDAFLAGFDSDEFSDEDSSDDEAEEPTPVDVKDLPKVTKQAKDTEKSKKKTEKPVRGVVYLGHLPHGFYEAQLSSYLSQFGTIRRLRLSRSKRTGRSKGYAFVEFEHLEVAEIVVETMDGYLLTGRLIKAEVVDESKVHRRMWEGSGKRFRPDQSKRAAREKHNADKAPEQQSAIAARLVRRESAKRKRIEELGIDYDFPGYAATAPQSNGTPAKASKRSADDDEIDSPKTKKSKKDSVQTKGAGKRSAADSTADTANKPKKARASVGGEGATMKLRDGKKKAARKSV